MGARRGYGAGALPALTLCGAVALAWPVASPAAGQHGVHVLYSEKLELRAAATIGERKASTGEIRSVSFDAYGRRFELALAPNSRLSRALPQLKSASPTNELKLYAGTVNDRAGSWARVATRGADIHGMLWDGEDLYVIEPSAAMQDTLLEDRNGAEGNLIFRLADTLLEPGAMSCATATSAERTRGAAMYESLIGELKGSPVIMQAIGASRRLELATLGDSLFRQRHADEQQARDEILVRLNNVDGIFSSQVGVEIQASLVEVLDAAGDPFSGTTSPSTLLGELGQVRLGSPSLRSRGLTHLFTGRDLDGSTVGIAYVDSLCRADSGVGLTEVNGRGAWLESLIAAHEIGHNFGAVHDGEEICASTPPIYLMAPGVDAARTTFSQCSLDSMLPRVDDAACITALAPADVAVPSDLGTTQHALGQSFEWMLQVTNVGGLTATGVRVEILVPPSITVDEAWVSGGSCTSGAGVIACELAELAGGGSRNVHLTLYSTTAGSNSVSARISADDDSQAGNNSGDGTLIIVDDSGPPAPSAPATSSSGGGSTGVLTLLALAALARFRGMRNSRRLG